MVSSLNSQTYVRLTVTYLWENLPQILLVGLLFSFCCAPAFVLLTLGFFLPALAVGLITVAPAWAALLALEAALVRDQPASPFHFFSFFARFWWRAVRLAALLSLPLVVAQITLPLLAQPIVPWFVWLGLAADSLGLLVMSVLALYAFPLLVLHDLDLYPALRNSLILASRHLLNTLGMLSMGLLFLFAIAYLSAALLFLLPAVWGIFLVNNCRLVVLDDHQKQ